MPDEIPNPIPALRVVVEILHATPQTRLQHIRMPAKQPHDSAPTQTRKDGPTIPLDAPLPRTPARQPVQPAAPTRPDVPVRPDPPLAHPHRPARRDRELGEPQHHAREDVDDNLLVDAAGLGAAVCGAAAEDDVAAGEAGDEGVDGGLVAWFAGGVEEGGGVAEEVEQGFVRAGEEGEIEGVLARCAVDGEGFCADAKGLFVSGRKMCAICVEEGMDQRTSLRGRGRS